MNFPNFNPDSSSHHLENLFHTTEKDAKYDLYSTEKANSNRDFERILEKKSQQNKLDESKDYLENKEINAEKEVKTKENKNNTDPIDITEKPRKDQENQGNEIKQLLVILEKIIQNKEISRSEHTFLLKNQNLLSQIGNKIKNVNFEQSQLSFKQLLSSIQNGVNKTDQISKELVTKIETFVLQLKNSLNANSENLSNQNNLNQKTPTKLTLSGLEKLSDLSNLNSDISPKSLRLEEAFVKPSYQFGVLKGNLDRNSTKGNRDSYSTNNGDNSLKTNPTHTQTKGINKTSEVLGMNNTGSQTSSAQLQRNTVVNFSTTSTSEHNTLVTREGVSFTPNQINNISNRMFAGQTTYQGINIRPFIEYLTSNIHRGFVSGQQVMLVKLQPENLGSIGLLLRKENENSLHLKLNVDSVEVKELIEKYSVDIKAGLSKENLDLLSFDVNVNGNSTDAHGEQNDLLSKQNNKKFNEISANEQKDYFNEENTETVDLRMNKGILNIKI